MKNHTTSVLTLTFMFPFATSWAQEAPQPAQPVSPVASAASSQPVNQVVERIITQGVPDKGVMACASCHGTQGEGNAMGGFPQLASQPEAYLAKQLTDYAEGRRKNAVMEPIAQGLTPEERSGVAAYYAKMPTANTATAAGGTAPQPTSKGANRGQVLAKVGDESKQVQACINCHGPGGSGSAPTYPSLAGQHASYLIAALQAFASGARTNDETGQMPAIARRLGSDDIAAVSAYFAARQPPEYDPAAAAKLKEVRQQAAQGSTSVTPAHPENKEQATGIGTEQGSPTTGGSQGPGGASSGSRNTPR